MTSDTSDYAFAFSMDTETPIPTMNDMEGQKDESDKYMWYSEITK